jgi:hypothetical protein
MSSIRNDDEVDVDEDVEEGGVDVDVEVVDGDVLW